jgi:matrixin
MKRIFLFLIVSMLVVSFVGAFTIPANNIAKTNAAAPDHSPVITYDWELDLVRVDFIHYAKGGNPGKPDKPGKPGDDPDPDPVDPDCYALMGVEWKSGPVEYTINPSNPFGLDENFVTNAISTSAETWDDATSIELVNDNYAIDYSSAYGSRDYENVIDFGRLRPRVIGVTSVWYSTVTYEIVESDMRLNTRYRWGDAISNSNLMDLQNIVTHEFGHVVGLADVYEGACNTVTMYGYSGEGDTSKRILEQPDITGLNLIY